MNRGKGRGGRRLDGHCPLQHNRNLLSDQVWSPVLGSRQVEATAALRLAQTITGGAKARTVFHSGMENTWGITLQNTDPSPLPHSPNSSQIDFVLS